MTDQQITVEQLKQHVLDLLHGICPAECLGDVDLSLPNFESKVMIFAAQQRADATQQLQRENAEPKAEIDESQSYRVIATPVTDEELMAYASEAQFFLFAGEDEVLDIMKETLSAFASRCASKTINRLKDELAAAKQQLAEAEKDAEIGAAVNRACKELPEGYFIVICLENGAGDIQLQCPDYQLSRSDFEHEADTFGGQINAAIDAARTAQAGEKQG